MKIKRLLKDAASGGSQALYIHYEDKMGQLTALMKMTNEYKVQKSKLADWDECVICSEEFVDQPGAVER